MVHRALPFDRKPPHPGLFRQTLRPPVWSFEDPKAKVRQITVKESIRQQHLERNTKTHICFCFHSSFTSWAGTYPYPLPYVGS